MTPVSLSHAICGVQPNSGSSVGAKVGMAVVGMPVGVEVGADVVGTVAVGLEVGMPVGATVVGSEGICDGNGVGTKLGGSTQGPQYPKP